MEYTLHIIDDRSTDETVNMIRKIAPNASINLLGQRDDSHLNPKQKSRYSASKALEYIYNLPQDDLVYLVEDDYLHYPDSMERMIEAYQYFDRYLPNVDIGIFTQDFPELYAHPRNLHNETYFKECYVFPGPDRYYRTTWYTHESFMIPTKVMHKYRMYFDALLTIGNEPHFWEGNTISNVWCQPDVTMLMPMRTLAIHVSKMEDIPFFNNDFEMLWEQNKIS
jgi:glycosyltransferase involved in cell wall biosynthesis